MVDDDATPDTDPAGAGVADTGAGSDSGAVPIAAMPPDLSMVVLSVRDMPALRAYYRALGWQEQAGASDLLCMFGLGRVTLTLHPETEPIDQTETGADRPAVTLVVRVGAGEEVDTACSSAVRAGARMVSEPRDQSWGGRSALVADPEGNRWEVLFVPLATPVEPGDRPAPR
jgi:uncharacterized protein